MRDPDRRKPGPSHSTAGSLAARGFEVSDLAACLAIFDSNVPDFFHEAEREEFVAFLEALPGPYLVLTDGEQVVACGGHAVGEQGTADLCWGMVRRDLHGQGYGQRLTQLRIGLALEQPAIEAVRLSTSQHTRGFYERLGFRLVAFQPEGFGPGLDRCDLRLEARPLREPHGSD